MRVGELECVHGVGHSAGVHGCDGCCTPIVRKAKAEAWEEGWKDSLALLHFADNPYRTTIKISTNDYDQLRKALDTE